MQAIILAAGMGRRLKDLTKNNTKCMIKVNGITLIERMLKQLDRLKLSRIVIVVGYRSDNLIGYISGLNVQTPVNYVENPIYDKTNNIYSLYLAKDYMRQQDTLLLESDLIYDDCVLEALVEDPRPSLALVAKYESWMDGTVVTLHPDERISGFFNKSKFKFSEINSYYKTVNLYKFSQLFAESFYIPFLEAYCKVFGNNVYYEQVLSIITLLDISELRAKVLDKGKWYEIDDIQDLDIAESLFTETAGDKLARVQKRYGGYWRYPKMLDFCYLVNPFFPTQKLLDEIKASFDIIATQYPSGQYVNSLLAAKHFGVSVEYMATGNGAAELINALMGMISGDIGVIFPTFEEYPNRKPGETVEFYPKNRDFSYTADDLISFFGDKNLSALVVVNPDNPSGNYLDSESVLRLADWTKSQNIRLVLDESFVDFADAGETAISDEILEKYTQLAVIKSISKSYGIPGLRLGVLASGDAGLISEMRKRLSIWNINSFAEYYLQISEKYRDDYSAALELFKHARKDFYALLAEIGGVEPVPSSANYFMCRLTGISAKELAGELLIRHDIFIKDLSGKRGFDGECIRVAIRTPEENQRLASAMKEILRQKQTV